MAQRQGFEPWVHFCTQPFQDCTFDHSDISANIKVVKKISLGIFYNKFNFVAIVFVMFFDFFTFNVAINICEPINRQYPT